MANGPEHKAAAAISCLVALSADTDRNDLAEISISTFAAYCMGRLPDILEPANNPLHRRFFHSMAMGGFVAYGGYKAYQWRPDSWPERAMRAALVAGSIAYISHLALDAFTPRSLPLM
ncbi:metal-dependent hydrolase [Alloalcanivorax venustensis]|uniref:metal-dependent hydrolase n=1 Tax=Alloalcanivorax venustensis TaxID=172371 RepID=UPI00189141F6|nr:metal-dependent hydrolase [Alloalcanivorax venustensis]